MPPHSTESRGIDAIPGDGELAQAHILIVDDDADVRLALETYLQSEGFTVTTAADGKEALDLMQKESNFDLVVLDVMLPGMNGFEVLRASQEAGVTIPVLMMSGRGRQEDILNGFGLGAQDYLVKPFEPEDLVNRTKELLGRAFSHQEVITEYENEDLYVDFESNEVKVDGERIALSELEMDILRYLIQHRGYVVTKKRLLKEAWRMDEDLIAMTIDPDIALETLNENVVAIKRKIESNSDSALIEAVYGLGYRFNG